MEKRKHAGENRKYLEKSKIENRETDGGKEIKKNRKEINERNKQSYFVLFQETVRSQLIL